MNNNSLRQCGDIHIKRDRCVLTGTITWYLSHKGEIYFWSEDIYEVRNYIIENNYNIELMLGIAALEGKL